MTTRYGGISTGKKIRAEDGSERTVYRGERGGRFYVYRNQKIHLPRSGIPVAIPLKRRGVLTSLGYHAHASEAIRHKALRAAVRAYGRGDVIKRVNVLQVYNKNKHPELARIYAADKAFVQRLV